MQAIGIISLVLSVTAIVVSYIVYRNTRALTTYSNVDRLYFDLLNRGMEYPEFVNPEYTQDYETKFADNINQKIRYELYAFNVWNICETVFDYRKNKGVLESWKPVLDNENFLHRRWFDQPSNRRKFKASFVDFIENEADKDGQKMFPRPYQPLK